MYKKKVIFYIEAPFQLLSAYEAIESYNITEYIIVIRLSNIDNNDKQLIYLAKLLFTDSTNINYINISISNRTIFDYFKILYMIMISYFTQYRYKYIFIGNLESKILSKIVKLVPKNKIILLDDGIKSITFQNNFSEKYYYNLYTMLDNLEPMENQEITLNKFNRLNNKINNIQIQKDTLLFIGSKLSESSIIDEDYYINYIDTICKRYKFFKILYIVHRGEDEKKLNKISKIKNIKIVLLDYPIELFPIYNGYLPSHIASFYSAALISLYKIYPKIKVESYFLKNINEKFEKNIIKAYEYIAKYIKIVELND